MDSTSHGRKNKRLATWWVPSGFHPQDALPPRLLVHCRSAMYLMHTIITRMAHRKKFRTTGVPLKMEYLRKVIGRKACLPLVNALIDKDEIRRVGGYLAGHYAYHYLPAKRYVSQPLRQYSPPAEFLERLSKIHAQTAKSRNRRAIHKVWEKWQQHLEIEFDQAQAAIARLPLESNPYGVQSLLIDRIRHGDHRFTVDRFGRVHNDITCLHRSLRSTLRMHGKPVQGVDIVNSQPGMLAVMISNRSGHRPGVLGHRESGPSRRPPLSIYDGTPFTPPEGFEEYTRLVTNGGLYEHLADVTGLGRRQVKKGLLRDVFGKKGEYPSPIEDEFRKSFPGVWAFIRRYNQDDHATLLWYTLSPC